jgi:hypothetical protein
VLYVVIWEVHFTLCAECTAWEPCAANVSQMVLYGNHMMYYGTCVAPGGCHVTLTLDGSYIHCIEVI